MTTREEETIIELFPMLSSDKGYKVTSENTRDYNCIAWAIGRDDIWYWPYLGNEHDTDEYWPEGVPDTDDIQSFVLAMESEGFVRCKTGELESGYMKIALFHQSGKCTHAARQLESGLWTSKMGPLHDIQHSTPQALEGDFYGTVYCYMRTASPQPSPEGKGERPLPGPDTYSETLHSLRLPLKGRENSLPQPLQRKGEKKPRNNNKST